MTHIHHDNVDQFTARKPRVFLDAIEMDGHSIFEVNEEGGYLVLGIMAKDGNIFCDPRVDEIRQVKLFGRVDITFGDTDLSKEQRDEISRQVWVKRVKREDA